MCNRNVSEVLSYLLRVYDTLCAPILGSSRFSAFGATFRLKIMVKYLVAISFDRVFLEISVFVKELIIYHTF